MLPQHHGELQFNAQRYPGPPQDGTRHNQFAQMHSQSAQMDSMAQAQAQAGVGLANLHYESDVS